MSWEGGLSENEDDQEENGPRITQVMSVYSVIYCTRKYCAYLAVLRYVVYSNTYIRVSTWPT